MKKLYLCLIMIAVLAVSACGSGDPTVPTISGHHEVQAYMAGGRSFSIYDMTFEVERATPFTAIMPDGHKAQFAVYMFGKGTIDSHIDIYPDTYYQWDSLYSQYSEYADYFEYAGGNHGGGIPVTLRFNR